MKTRTVKITQKQYDELVKLKKEDGRCLRWLMDKAVNEFVEKYKDMKWVSGKSTVK